jgi:hypothetical protein
MQNDSVHYGYQQVRVSLRRESWSNGSCSHPQLLRILAAGIQGLERISNESLINRVWLKTSFELSGRLIGTLREPQ